MTGLSTTMATPTRASRFAGLGGLLRKDIEEWIRGRRPIVVAVVVTIFMVLAVANAAIVAFITANLPPDVDPPDAPTSMAPMDNLLAGIGSQIFVFAAIFAVISLLATERESGTLAWVASKPVARGAIWVSKWVAASALLVVSAVIVPLVVTGAIAVVLYGVPDLAALLVIAVGMALAVTFYAALGLAAGTILHSQAAVAAVGLGAFFLPDVIGAVLPFSIAPYLPTSILPWSVGLATGAPVGWATPIAWLIGTAVLVLFSVRQLQRSEL